MRHKYVFFTVIFSTIMLSYTAFSQNSNEWFEENGILPKQNPEKYLDKAPPDVNFAVVSDSLFQLLFQYPVGTGGGEAGIETDGVYIYTVKWNGSEIYRYQMDGTFIGSFIMVPGIRDLAYDGTYFYGGDASTIMYEMDFSMELLVSTINAPTEIRALAYNEDDDVFYANNWSTSISCFDRTGALIYSAAPGPVGSSYYGFAYDNYCTGQYLWGYAQTGASNNEIIQMELPSFLETGVYFNIGGLIPPTTGVAGGLCVDDHVAPGYWALMGMMQNEWIWGLELCSSGPGPVNDVGASAIISPQTGVLSNSETVTIDVKNYGSVSQSNIPAYFVFEGNPYNETIPGPLDPGQTISYSFTQTIDCSVSGATYTLDACTDLAGDENPNNDCKSTSFTNLPGGLLLVPEHTNDNVMAFDPATGNLIDPAFITNPGDMSTPIQAILNAEGDGILVSDQVKDVVFEFDLSGNYLGIFAPAGGANTAIMDNIRGICLRPNGNLLVTVAGGTNQDCIAEFDTNGNYLGNFIPNGSCDPFDIIYRSNENDYLVADIQNPDYIRRYDENGNFIENITDYVNFPEQLSIASNGNILAACFSSPSGVHEYLPDGTLVGVYDPVTSCRGVYELPNNNILTTNNDGVHEIDRFGNLIETKISGVGSRFISFIELSPSASVSLDIKAFLEGPYNGVDMYTNLNSLNDFPLLQPFNIFPWYYTGTESISAVPNTDIVDWILVELRETTGGASTATFTTMIAQQAAFLLNDGSVVGLDGTSMLSFDLVINENLFVVIWHRNHLGVLSANPLVSNNGIYSYDFTSAAGQAYGAQLGHKDIGNGVFGMIGGDGLPDGQIGNSDKIDVWITQAGQAGYLAGDYNLDAQVNSQDKVDVWGVNSGTGTQVPN